MARGIGLVCVVLAQNQIFSRVVKSFVYFLLRF
jgi:hypothetical protein